MNVLTFALLFLGSTTAGSMRVRRGSYSLPDGSEFIVGLLKTSFRCRANGYFADVDNHCQVFHVCHEQPNFMGPSRYQLFSFVCGNTTIFDQLTLTCMYPEDAIPCGTAPLFYDVNSNVGDEGAYFLTDDDVERGAHHVHDSPEGIPPPHSSLPPPPPQPLPHPPPHPPLRQPPHKPPYQPVHQQHPAPHATPIEAPDQYFTDYRDHEYFDHFEDSPPLLTTTSTTTSTTTTTTPRPSTTRFTSRPPRRSKYFQQRSKTRTTLARYGTDSPALHSPLRTWELHRNARRKGATVEAVPTSRPMEATNPKPEIGRKTKIIVTAIRRPATRQPASTAAPHRKKEDVRYDEKFLAGPRTVAPFDFESQHTVNSTTKRPRHKSFEDETPESLLKELEEAFARDYPNIHTGGHAPEFPGVVLPVTEKTMEEKSEPLVLSKDDVPDDINTTAADKQEEGEHYNGIAVLTKDFIQIVPKDFDLPLAAPIGNASTVTPDATNVSPGDEIQVTEALVSTIEEPLLTQHERPTWKDGGHNNTSDTGGKH